MLRCFSAHRPITWRHLGAFQHAGVAKTTEGGLSDFARGTIVVVVVVIVRDLSANVHCQPLSLAKFRGLN